MKFISLWKVLDDFSPLWVNADGESEYSECKSGVRLLTYGAREVEYITHDSDGILTIELGAER